MEAISSSAPEVTAVPPKAGSPNPPSVPARLPRAETMKYPVYPDNQLGMETQEKGQKAETPLATPCRSIAKPPAFTPEAPCPSPGALHLSQDAIEQRLRRLMTPKWNGQLKISGDVVDMYKKGGKTKQDVYYMFQAAGFDVDWFEQNVEHCFNMLKLFRTCCKI